MKTYSVQKICLNTGIVLVEEQFNDRGIAVLFARGIAKLWGYVESNSPELFAENENFGIRIKRNKNY